ncbi:MAG TPA: SDR family oxidoreductase [Rhizomicrobium sp.]|jgi:NAD(P)-dependent dehydrogenase (short-subunit alcohol dehydrogenase family)
MLGKTVVVTGGTSGIGEVAALALARKGARIVVVARDRARGEDTLARLRTANPTVSPSIHYADLSNIADMKRVANEIAAAEPRIDVLVNNAGAVFLARHESVDGLEMTFATNHMAYFVVTNLLLDRLKATGNARIVSTASDAHKAGKLDFDDLQAKKHYSVFGAYGTSKLENILFTRELAERLEGSGVTANCLHPGFVGTRFGQNNAKSGFLKFVAKTVMAFGLSPEDGARTIIYLASSPEVEGKSGGYYYKCKAIAPTAAAQSGADAKRLWEVSKEISGVG